MLVYADADGDAVFSMDRPSAAFGSLGIAAVARVGEDLDRKVANLLRAIGIDAAQAFRTLDAVNPAESLTPPDSGDLPRITS